MLYREFLKTLTSCPFCSCKDRILAENELAFLTFAKAPYHKDHLLVIPKRHVVKMLDLNEAEEAAIDSLVKKAIACLNKMGAKNVSVLVRDGVADDIIKSIAHIHYHIVPEIRIGDVDHHGKERTVMSDAEIEKMTTELSRYL